MRVDVQVAELCGLGIFRGTCTANLVQPRETVRDLTVGEEFQGRAECVEEHSKD